MAPHHRTGGCGEVGWVKVASHVFSSCILIRVPCVSRWFRVSGCSRPSRLRSDAALRASVHHEDEPHPRHFDDVANRKWPSPLRRNSTRNVQLKKNLHCLFAMRGTNWMSRNTILLPGIETAARLVGNTPSTAGILEPGSCKQCPQLGSPLAPCGQGRNIFSERYICHEKHYSCAATVMYTMLRISFSKSKVHIYLYKLKW